MQVSISRQLPKEVPVDLEPGVGHVLQVGDAKKFPHALRFEGLDPFLGASEQGPHSH